VRFSGFFPPILRFEKLEIHTVFLRFSNLGLTKNLSPKPLAELCGAALKYGRCTFFIKKGAAALRYLSTFHDSGVAGTDISTQNVVKCRIHTCFL